MAGHLLVRLEDIKFVSDFTLNSMNKRAYSKKRGSMFGFVGLMLSRVCSGNCIFCPVPKLQHEYSSAGRKPFMSLGVAEKTVADLGSMSYSGWINLGENGDALLNPDFRDIVRTISQSLPSAKITLYTNMARMDKELSLFLLEHNLSELVVNVDGSTKEVYESAKRGLKYETVRDNLLEFIRIRSQTRGNCRILIQVIPPKRYMTLRKHTDIDVQYDFLDIVGYWRPYLLVGDSFQEVKYFWNWNSEPSKEIRKKSCPMIPSLLNSCYVSTEGDVYTCCLDPLTKLTFGNIMEKSVERIWNSEKRRCIVSNIVNKEFKKVGEPCTHCNERNDFLTSYLDYVKCSLISKSKRLLKRLT